MKTQDTEIDTSYGHGERVGVAYREPGTGNRELISPPTFPARPINGGPLPKAPAKSGNWHYEPKFNGWRALVHVPSGTMFNRKGEKLSISGEFKPALDNLRVTLDAEAFNWADCEALERRHTIGRGTLIVLDVIPEPEHCGSTYLERRGWLERTLEVAPAIGIDSDEVYLTSSYASGDVLWSSLQTSNALLRDWQSNNAVAKPQDFYEGVVAKRTDARYPMQLRRPDEETHTWMKHRWAW